ncbi:MAG: glycosyl transferase, family 2 [Devosia sp.]|nr:glycosyl transferase, family 2 [Devosia sp.]
MPDHSLAIVAIVKNEGPYLLEWLAFHRAVGVEQFFIYDNASDDGSTELLAGLHRLGVVTHIPFPTPPDTAPQLAAYTDAMDHFADRATWFAFIDADEFLTPADPTQSVVGILSGMGREVGAVVINWAIYGSSEQRDGAAGLVIERFTHRADADFPVNLHYKSVVRGRAFRAVQANPHHFKLRFGYRSVHIDGAPLDRRSPSGLSAALHWSPLRLNHFVIKSRAEFEKKKIARGRAMIGGAARTLRFFKSHDRNDVADPIDQRLVAMTRCGIAELKADLQTHQVPVETIDLDHAVLGLVPTDPLESPALSPRYGRHLGRGSIMRLVLLEGTIEASGWVIAADGREIRQLQLVLDGLRLPTLEIDWHSRPEPLRISPTAPPRSGFRIISAFPDRTPEQLAGSTLWAEIDEGDFAIRLIKRLAWPPTALATARGRE